MKKTIGVFDSGFGGLTVLRELVRHVPDARYLYFGDTARLPYGSKSAATVARYAAEAAQFLQQRGMEMLVVACNTATALALPEIKAAVQVPVEGVIEPGAERAAAASRRKKVVVVATEATINSHAYARASRRAASTPARRPARCWCRWWRKDGSTIPLPSASPTSTSTRYSTTTRPAPTCSCWDARTTR